MLAFQHWMVIVQLLKLGIPYESIKTFTVDEINIIVASEMAIQQKQQEEQVRDLSSSQAKSSFGRGGF
tara:strand:+ start:3287 stop:3490 length:204 start_codon:yes stop_codon:yes gene_type:complete